MKIQGTSLNEMAKTANLGGPLGSLFQMYSYKPYQNGLIKEQVTFKKTSMNEFIGPYCRPWIYGPPPFSSSKARVSPHVFSRNMALPVASPQKEALKSGK